MNNLPQRTKGIGSLLVGIVQCILGGLLTLIFGIVIFSCFNGESVDQIGSVIVYLLFFAGGIILLRRGIRNATLYSRSSQIQGIMAGKMRERLSLILQVTKQDYTHLVQDLRLLSAKGYFPGGYVDLYRREFVLHGGGPLPNVDPGPTMLREVQKKSVLPIYLIGAVWALYALLFPLYRWYDFAIALAASVTVYIVARRTIPTHTVIVEEARKAPPPPKPEAINTGNEELDEALTAAMGYMSQLTALDSAITNPAIDKSIQDMVYICKQIFDYIKKTPGKVRQIRQFMNYYLPTTINLLQNYDELSRQPVKGDNITAAMNKIENTMWTILKAFQKELDNLYQDKAMDISVDIEVMESMMEQEGLTGDILRPNQSE